MSYAYIMYVPFSVEHKEQLLMILKLKQRTRVVVLLMSPVPFSWNNNRAIEAEKRTRVFGFNTKNKP
jgi:hypothetical protein